MVLLWIGHLRGAEPELTPEERARLEKEATELNVQAMVMYQRGLLVEAVKVLRQATEMYQKLYPENKYPAGHPDLAATLHNMAFLLESQGESGEALDCYRQALQMYQQFYPENKYPVGHPHLAVSLSNVGALLRSQGEYAKALGFSRQALEMRQKLYPESKYPAGHPDLAASLNNIGFLLQSQGEYGKAMGFYRQALQMYQKLYPEGKYPAGHSHLAVSLNNMGGLLGSQGEYGKAMGFYRQALEMCQKLYPESKYPAGHPDLAASLNNMGLLLQSQEEYGKAMDFYRRALEMCQKLYPAGHPDLAASLGNMGSFLQSQGEYSKAMDFYRQALATMQAQFTLFADTASEAEMLNFLAKDDYSRDRLLSIGLQAREVEPREDHALFWDSKSTLPTTLQRRQRLARGVADNATRARLHDLLDKRQQLARLLLAPADPTNAKTRLERLGKLTQEKEAMERELANRIPELKREQARKLARPADLAKNLPADAAFLDLFRYDTWDAKSRKWAEGRYAAFVLRPNKSVIRVELGEGKHQAEAIERTLAQWRQDIANNHNSQAAEQLRRLVWEPIRKYIPDGIKTIYLCPDGELSALPWGALPGDAKNTVLLEQYAIALVPSGLALLEQLTDDAKLEGRGSLMAVGGVAYDDKPEVKVAKRDPVRGADVGDKIAPWKALPATAKEIDQILNLAGGLKEPPSITEMRGKQASTTEVLKQLQQARVAHLATHGFFAAPRSAERKALFDENTFGFGVGMERRGAATRNPLVQSGLVLTGANVLPRDGLDDDGGILTAESIAGADLRQMRLAVLSACETGLGETATLGQGVFGLQRALHMGGCRDVVASLWKVDDEATAALMALFYKHLWVDGDPPLKALRRAQLELMRSPKAMPELARSRGSKFAEVVKEVEAVAARPTNTAGPAPVKHWAAFVLSGSGR